jgi:soluble lytic murein transglycosylase-like protein
MSVTEIQARMATIQAQFGAVAVAPARAAGPAAASPPFEQVLTEATAATATSPAGDWTHRLPAEARPHLDALTAAAESAGVDPKLVAAVAWTESGFRGDAVSGAGAQGLMQLMPATAAGLGVDPRDPRQNLEGGARYLAEQLDRFGRVDLALAAYNAGPGAVARHGGIPPYPETRAYVDRVLERLASL